MTVGTCEAEQELFTLPEHLSPPPVFSGVCVVRSFIFWCSVLQIVLCLFCPFSFGHYVVCRSIYGFGLPLGIFKLVIDCVCKQYF